MGSTHSNRQYRPSIEQLEDRTNPSTMFDAPVQHLVAPPRMEILVPQQVLSPANLATQSQIIMQPQLDLRAAADRVFSSEYRSLAEEAPVAPLGVGGISRDAAVRFLNHEMDAYEEAALPLLDKDYLQKLRTWLKGKTISAMDHCLPIFSYPH